MLKKIKNKLTSKNGKVLIENFVSLSALQIFSMILPFITLPYLLRTIGLSNYGVIIMATTLVSYFTSVTDFSFRITATRDVSIFRNSPKKLDIIFSKVVIIQSVLLIISILIITLIIFLYPPFYENKVTFFLSMLFLIGYTLFPDWFFQGIEKMKYVTIINLSIKVFFTIGVFVFIREKSDYWIYPLMYGLGYVVSGLIGYYILIRRYSLKLVYISKRNLVATVKGNMPIFINQFFPNLYNNTSVLVLGILTNTSMVGMFDAIKKVINLGTTVIDILSKVFFPFINRQKKSFRSYMTLMLVLGTILTLMPIALHKLIFWYLSLAQPNSFIILCILSFGLFFMTLYNIFGLNYFIVHRQDSVVMKNTIISSLIGFALVYPLVYYFGVIGAAINLTFCRGLMGIGLFIKFRKYSNTK